MATIQTPRKTKVREWRYAEVWEVEGKSYPTFIVCQTWNGRIVEVCKSMDEAVQEAVNLEMYLTQEGA